MLFFQLCKRADFLYRTMSVEASGLVLRGGHDVVSNPSLKLRSFCKSRPALIVLLLHFSENLIQRPLTSTRQVLSNALIFLCDSTPPNDRAKPRCPLPVSLAKEITYLRKNLVLSEVLSSLVELRILRAGLQWIFNSLKLIFFKTSRQYFSNMSQIS